MRMRTVLLVLLSTQWIMAAGCQKKKSSSDDGNREQQIQEAKQLSNGWTQPALAKFTTDCQGDVKPVLKNDDKTTVYCSCVLVYVSTTFTLVDYNAKAKDLAKSDGVLACAEKIK